MCSVAEMTSPKRSNTFFWSLKTSLKSGHLPERRLWVELEHSDPLTFSSGLRLTNGSGREEQNVQFIKFIRLESSGFPKSPGTVHRRCNRLSGLGGQSQCAPTSIRGRVFELGKGTQPSRCGFLRCLLSTEDLLCSDICRWNPSCSRICRRHIRTVSKGNSWSWSPDWFSVHKV
jgi:hypothetical protein